MAKRKTNAKEVIALHDNGQRTLQAVADMVGVSRERVRQILAKNNRRQRRGHGFAELQSPEWLKAHQHLTTKEAATKLGCTAPTIWRWAHIYGIKMQAAPLGSPPLLDDNTIRSLASDPRPLRELSLEVGAHRVTISRQMIRLGIGRGRRWKRGAPFCWRGHPFNKENTYTKGGRRWCRACGRIRNKKSQRRLQREREVRQVLAG